MQLITRDEFLMGRIKFSELTKEQQENADKIIAKVNTLLLEFGEYRKCNSGYRSVADQARINLSAPKSKHLLCAAIDISDVDGKFHAFLKKRTDLLEQLDLYCEERMGTWQHVQCLPPASKRRWFNP